MLCGLGKLMCKCKKGNLCLRDTSALGELVKHGAKVLSRQCLGLGFCKREEPSIGEEGREGPCKVSGHRGGSFLLG